MIQEVPFHLDLGIKFLWNASASIPGRNHTEKLLQSYYLTKILQRTKDKVILPKALYGNRVRCQKCLLAWDHGTRKLSIKSPKTSNARLQRRVKSLEDNKNLNEKQKKSLLKLKKLVSPSLNINCSFCKHKDSILMTKPVKLSEKPSNNKTKLTAQPKKKNPAKVLAPPSTPKIKVAPPPPNLKINSVRKTNKATPNNKKKNPSQMSGVAKANAKQSQNNHLVKLAHLLKHSGSSHQRKDKLASLLK